MARDNQYVLSHWDEFIERFAELLFDYIMFCKSLHDHRLIGKYIQKSERLTSLGQDASQSYLNIIGINSELLKTKFLRYSNS